MEKPKVVPGDVLATLRNCGGVYECPMDEQGPLTPPVGYAGQYEVDGKLLNYVGFVYYNVAQGDQWPHIARHWATLHAERFLVAPPDLLVAAPMGGVSYMSVLKQHLGCRGIFAEKKVTKAAEPNRREESRLILGRYDVCAGDRIVIIEDIVNNYSTTKQMIELVEAAGGTVTGIACVINRSDQTVYQMDGHQPIAVISLLHKPTPQYRQDHPAVAEHIAAGNVVMKPKERWDELMAKEAAART
ncbi:MAG: phosphoribosyltransferase [Candidatus Moraniibacteriota bacterium]